MAQQAKKEVIRMNYVDVEQINLELRLEEAKRSGKRWDETLRKYLLTTQRLSRAEVSALEEGLGIEVPERRKISGKRPKKPIRRPEPKKKKENDKERLDRIRKEEKEKVETRREAFSEEFAESHARRFNQMARLSDYQNADEAKFWAIQYLQEITLTSEEDARSRVNTSIREGDYDEVITWANKMRYGQVT